MTCLLSEKLLGFFLCTLVYIDIFFKLEQNFLWKECCKGKGGTSKYIIFALLWRNLNFILSYWQILSQGKIAFSISEFSKPELLCITWFVNTLCSFLQFSDDLYIFFFNWTSIIYCASRFCYWFIYLIQIWNKLSPICLWLISESRSDNKE